MNMSKTSAGGRSISNPAAVVVMSSAMVMSNQVQPPPAGSMSSSRSAACKSTHKEAERLRRKRINAHLATLRTLLPNLLKTDKASLLGEVVRRVRELKQSASAPTAPLVPDDTDIVSLAPGVGVGVVVATLSCEDRPGLLSDLSRALQSVRATPLRAEFSTVGGRSKAVLCLQCASPAPARDGGLAALSRALRVVVDTPTPTSSSAFGPFPSKRQRLCP